MSATATRPQALIALDAANEIRMARADLKRQVRAGVVDVRDLILDPPAILDSEKHPVTVTQILSWQWRWGVKRARIFLTPLGVGPYTTPFDLTPARREQIARRLP